MALISVDDIATLLGETLDSDDETVIELYINFAVGEIEAWLGRPISVTSFSEDVIADADGIIYLSNTPVVSVTSITIDSEVQDLANYNTMPWGIEAPYFKSRVGVIDYWTEGDRVISDFDEFYEPEIIVAYTAGLDTPDGVNSVIASAVIRKWEERKTTIQKAAAGSTGIEKLRVEDYAIEYESGNTFQTSSYGSGANPMTMFRSDKDFNSIKRFKRRSIG